MHAAVLSLVVLFAPMPQDTDPDLSSPDKTAQAWAEFWMDLQHNQNPFKILFGKVEDTTLPAMTPEAQRKAKERAEKSKDMFAGNETLSWKIKVDAVEDADGGGKEVTVSITRTFNKKDWRTKAVKKTTETKPNKYLMKKHGGKWLIFKTFKPCFSCEGKGVCGTCKGTGKRAGNTGDCFRCNGGKTCSQCKGEKFREDKLAKVGMSFIKESVKLDVKQDYSSPQKAAETWIQLERKKELTGNHLMGSWVNKVFKQMRKFLVPELVKEIDTQLVKGAEAGTKRFLEEKPKLKSVEEEQDGTAYAVVSSLGGGGLMAAPRPAGKKAKEQLKRLVLKKVGEKWLVDEVQRACHSCDGSKVCKQCAKGNKTGKCYSCNDSKKCRWCKGEGWRSSNF